MNPINAQITANGTYVFPLDYRMVPFNVNVEVNVSGATGAVYEIDYTLLDTNFPPNSGRTQIWTVSSAFATGSTTSQQGVFNTPYAMIRMVLTGLTAGTVMVNILQGDFVGT